MTTDVILLISTLLSIGLALKTKRVEPAVIPVPVKTQAQEF